MERSFSYVFSFRHHFSKGPMGYGPAVLCAADPDDSGDAERRWTLAPTD